MLSADRLPLEVYVALICNGVGTMGYVSVMSCLVLFCTLVAINLLSCSLTFLIQLYSRLLS